MISITSSLLFTLSIIFCAIVVQGAPDSPSYASYTIYPDSSCGAGTAESGPTQITIGECYPDGTGSVKHEYLSVSRRLSANNAIRRSHYSGTTTCNVPVQFADDFSFNFGECNSISISGTNKYAIFTDGPTSTTTTTSTTTSSTTTTSTSTTTSTTEASTTTATPTPSPNNAASQVATTVFVGMVVMIMTMMMMSAF